jgi:hypothetical protein
MDTVIASIYALSKGGYQIYNSIMTEDNCLVIEDSRGVLSKVLVRKASRTGTTPVITLGIKYRAQAYLENFGYFLAVESETPKVWLIPMADFPSGISAIRLGSRYEQYVVRTEVEKKELSSRIVRQEVKKRLMGKEAEIKQEDLEYLLACEVD